MDDITAINVGCNNECMIDSNNIITAMNSKAAAVSNDKNTNFSKCFLN